MTTRNNSNIVRLSTSPRRVGQSPEARALDEIAQPQTHPGYYARMELFAQKIRQTRDIRDIITTLEEALRETRALHTVDEVALAHEQVALAEVRIERLRNELELVSRLVREDQLTGALNRRGLDDALEREAARAERCVTPLCVALIDLDNFKGVNDSLGHQVGDRVLVHLVSIVMQTIRANDMIGRYGGDEFLVLMPGSQIDDANEVIARLQRQLTLKPLSLDNQELFVTFSAGVAMRRPGEASEAMVQRADRAMYEAKLAGRDRVMVTQER